MREQKVLIADEGYSKLDEYLHEQNIKKLLLVCDGAIRFLKINEYFNNLPERGIEVVRFSDFEPNPKYESVVAGVELLHSENCEVIIAVGGGSAMDVAKCIKLYSNMNPDINYLKQDIVPNDLGLIAVPTTAGTGSEATRYAVIYYNGEKQSVADMSCIPGVVLLDVSALKTLPIYQKKSTMLDALCHAIESYWSVNSTEESKQYSRLAIETIMQYKDAYLANEEDGNFNMLQAANLAGKAINITQTTAGHAMCYKLTSMYGLSHGHAATLCVQRLWPYMLAHLEDCIDARGNEYLKAVFNELADIMECETPTEAVERFCAFVGSLGLDIPKASSEQDYEQLKVSVNPVRLKNNPVQLDVAAIDMLYHEIVL